MCHVRTAPNWHEPLPVSSIGRCNHVFGLWLRFTRPLASPICRHEDLSIPSILVTAAVVHEVGRATLCVCPLSNSSALAEPYTTNALAYALRRLRPVRFLSKVVRRTICRESVRSKFQYQNCA